MLTTEELELFFSLLLRAGCNQIEATWANQVMAKLRVLVAQAQVKKEDEDATVENR